MPGKGFSLKLNLLPNNKYCTKVFWTLECKLKNQFPSSSWVQNNSTQYMKEKAKKNPC
jgi:hypothetical protein